MTFVVLLTFANSLDPDQALQNIQPDLGRRVVRKPGLQHHMGLDARNHDFGASEQQRRRPACADGQSEQHLCNLLSEK